MHIYALYIYAYIYTLWVYIYIYTYYICMYIHTHTHTHTFSIYGNAKITKWFEYKVVLYSVITENSHSLK